MEKTEQGPNQTNQTAKNEQNHLQQTLQTTKLMDPNTPKKAEIFLKWYDDQTHKTTLPAKDLEPKPPKMDPDLNRLKMTGGLCLCVVLAHDHVWNRVPRLN